MNSEERLESDVESLKRDFSRFKEDLNSVLAGVGHFGKRKVCETKDRFGIAMKNFHNTASEKINYAGSMAQEKSKQAVNSSRGIIVKKPLTAIGIAFACGAITTLIFKKSSND
jgi:ElaB/YqjD/DUF883 family membrane-anchored ribosome-binding protein